MKRKGHVMMQSHVEHASRVSKVKRESRVLAQPLDERDSLILKQRCGVGCSVTIAEL